MRRLTVRVAVLGLVAASLSVAPALVSPASAATRPSGTITLARPSTGQPVVLGTQITLRGRFKYGAHRAFVIQKRKPGTLTWHRMRFTRGTTNFRGVYRATFTPQHTFQYRALLLKTATKPSRVSKRLAVNITATWKSVDAGAHHSCGIRSNGSLWCWGDNGFGDLGNGSKYMSAVPVQVKDTTANAGEVQTWLSVSAGTDYTCGIRADGADPTKEGSLWCWGSAQGGVLGLTTVNGNPIDTTASSPTNVRHPQQVGTGTDWGSVSAGYLDTCAIKYSDHTLWCWGSNGAGELGIGNTNEQDTPQQVTSGPAAWGTVSVGYDHTCGTDLNNGAGPLYCWGNNPDGQLGTDPKTTTFSTTPILVDDSTTNPGAPQTWAMVSAGNGYTCGIRTDTTLWCWGDNANGQLGVGGTPSSTFTPLQISNPETGNDTWLSVSTGVSDTAGQGHTCAVHNPDSTHFTVWCWGYGIYGQLGNGSYTGSDVPVQVSDGYAEQNWPFWISAGARHTCGIREGTTVTAPGTLWCWGYGSYGQLGNGSQANRTKPRAVIVG